MDTGLYGALRGVPIYRSAFSVPTQGDGQAEWIWAAGYIPTRFSRPNTINLASNNRARRRVTSLIETNALSLSQTATVKNTAIPLYEPDTTLRTHN